jgi:hypothetical protein
MPPVRDGWPIRLSAHSGGIAVIQPSLLQLSGEKKLWFPKKKLFRQIQAVPQR